MKIKLYKSDGTESGEHEVDNFPTLEEGKGSDALRQLIVAVHANKRQGNASTKLRSEVSGSGKKIFRQKGLGLAGQVTNVHHKGEEEEWYLDLSQGHILKN
jgi:large subunit ribosomal protein L4